MISQIPDQSKQRFLFAGILCFTDKIIDKEVAEDIRRKLDMTKVGSLLVREIRDNDFNKNIVSIFLLC